MTTMNKNLDSNIKFFLQTQFQLRILHWQTKGYARHIAFGETYETLDGLIDSFVEVCMGKHGRFILQEENKTIKADNLAEVGIVDFLQNIKTTLIGLSSELSKENDTDLLNIRDEMLASINKLAYLLTLE
jgi:DNA-binding ferritin-like protein